MDPSQSSVIVKAGAVTHRHPGRITNSTRTGASLQNSACSWWCLHCNWLLYPQVEDPLPPVFSGTPKGSGAGYGVGFDLEEFLNQSFDMGMADGPQDG